MACSCHDTAATNTGVLVLPGAVVGSVAGSAVGSVVEVAGPVVVAASKTQQASASATLLATRSRRTCCVQAPLKFRYCYNIGLHALAASMRRAAICECRHVVLESMHATMGQALGSMRTPVGTSVTNRLTTPTLLL